MTFEQDPELTGVKMRLYDADPAEDGGPASAPVSGERLGAGTVDLILARVPPLEAEEGDRQAFALRKGSPPPPLSGSDVLAPFPPPTGGPGAPTLAPGPLQVSRWRPEGEVPLAPHVSITFDQPMVAVTSQDEAAKTVPARLEPTPAGHWRWLGTKTLLFDPDPRLPMATEFQVVVPAGTASATGGVLADEFRFSFATPPVSMQSWAPGWEPQPLEPVMVAVFDQKIDPDAVLAKVELSGPKGPVPVRAATREEIDADEQARALVDGAEDQRWIALRALEPLERASSYTVRLPEGLPSAEGPRRTVSGQSFSFSTFAPLAIVEHHCWWADPCPPTNPWMVRFNNPLEVEGFDPASVTVTPEVPGLAVQAYGDILQISGAFTGRTVYTLTVPASVGDRFGQTLGKAQELTFKVGPSEPTLSMPGGSMVVVDPAGGAKRSVFSTNHDALKVTIHAVEPGDWEAWMTWLQSLWYDDDRPKRLPGRPVFTGTIRPDRTADRMVETPLDLEPYLKSGAGQFVVLVEPTRQPRERWQRQYAYQWVQVTKLGLVAFADETHLTGWASDLATGETREGVRLELYPAGSHTDTGADGLGEIELPTTHTRRPLLLARDGADLAILPAHTEPWGGHGWLRGPGADALSWYVFDDRGLYRPGEQARIKGWVRVRQRGPQGDVAGLPSAPGPVRWTLIGAQGNELGHGEAEVSALGGFDLAVDLPADANLGTASLQLDPPAVPGVLPGSYTHPLQIQEFRRPEFEVSASVDDGPHLLGTHATVDLSASYYAGGGLANAEVTWTVYAEPGAYAPPGWAGFTFGTWIPWWSDAFGPGGASSQASHQATTDGAGEHHLGIHFQGLNPPRPMNIRAEGTVMDVNRQAWTATATTLLHPSDRYVGLKTERQFVEKGDPIELELVVTDLDGKPVADSPVAVTFARMEWEWRKGETARDPIECAVKTDRDGLARCRFDTVRGGSFRALARVSDALGRPNESELRVWVSGAELVPAREVSLEQVTLIPEKKELRPGEKARVLVQAPFWPAEGTLTVRRSGLAHLERFRLDEPSTTLEIDVTEAHVPNLFVQVDLIGAAPRVDDDGKVRDDLPRRVAHATGQVAFDVPPLSRALKVEVTPAADKVAPGTSTELALRVTGADGRPVAGAELAVVVADESVLALTGYQLPDPLEVFYAAREPGVSDHRLRDQVALADPTALATTTAAPSGSLGLLGSGVGGGGQAAAAPMEELAEDRSLEKAKKEDASPARSRLAASAGDAPAPAQPGPAIAVRTDFSALALFAPAVRTDEQGRATVPLQVPGSLTRYRVMVVAVDAGKRFGSAESAVTARLPLMVRPSPPRFLNFGDQAELPVVLQNQTDQEMVVDLAVRATNLVWVDRVGKTLPDLPDAGFSTAGRRVTIPANDRVEIRFPAATRSAGTARVQVVAASGTSSDAANLEFPVWTPATTEAFATYGEIDDGGIVQPVQAPPGSWPQFGGLEVTTASTQLQALTDAVLYLQSYPFECNEQLASRVLAIASLRDVLSAFDAEGLPEPAALEAQVADDLSRLARRQHWNGGFAFWRRGDEPWPFLSIHVANAFARARAKGFDVPDDAWNRSRQHLRDIESHIPWWYSDQARWFLRAYALDVRRRMGDADPREAKRLFDQAGTDGLGIDGLAFLLPTLHEDGRPEAAQILRHLANRSTEDAGTAHFVTGVSDGAHVLLHSDRRADGVVLEALIEVAPDDTLVPKVVRGLLAHKVKGRWSSTQENAFVLLALDRYFRVYEKETPDFVARAWLGEGYLGDHAYRGRTTERAHFEVPMGYLTERSGAQKLTLVKDGDDGRLYYRIGVRYAPRDLRLEAADYGFAVARTYEAIDDPADVRRDDDGTWHLRAGARIRVHLSMATEMRRYHVALVDPLPAGLEAQNPVLATTGTLPPDPTKQTGYWWWNRSWQEHENLRDERVEAFTSLLWDGVHQYSYVARATTPGRFVVPPARAEEMYMPETFGRSATDVVVIE